MRKGFTLIIAVAMLMIIAGCGGSGGNGTSTGNKYFTIKYSMPNLTNSSLAVKNLQYDETGTVDPTDPTDPEVIPEEVTPKHYFLNNPIPAGVIIKANDPTQVYPYWGAMCQVYEVDKLSGNQTVVENCSWSCEDPTIGKVTHSDSISADFMFSVRGKTKVIAKTPDGVEIAIPAHVYPCAMLNCVTDEYGTFQAGFIFDSETGTSTEANADIFIDSSTGEVRIKGVVCAIDQPFAQITEAPTETSKYTFNSFSLSETQNSYSNYIIKTNQGKYIKFRFAGTSSGSGYSVSFQYMVADASNKFAY